MNYGYYDHILSIVNNEYHYYILLRYDSYYNHINHSNIIRYIVLPHFLFCTVRMFITAYNIITIKFLT